MNTEIIDAGRDASGGYKVDADLPLSIHPAGTEALWVDTPIGAGGATGNCAELSNGAALLPVAANRRVANALGVS